jgi:hypothetical protein
MHDNNLFKLKHHLVEHHNQHDDNHHLVIDPTTDRSMLQQHVERLDMHDRNYSEPVREGSSGVAVVARFRELPTRVLSS